VNDDGSTFYFDVGEIVRFRVETEEWHDQIPNAPELADMPVQDRKPPYSIIVCEYMTLTGPSSLIS
jgi:DNA-directed RNA polymerase III subunit RPC8